MIDPPVLLTRISPKILKLRFSLDMERRLSPPVVLPTAFSLKVLNLRFSLYMATQRGGLLHEGPFTREGNSLVL